MKIGFLITARLKSTRLPLKLLREVGGKTIIEQVIYRSKKVAGIDQIVLCTSNEFQDLPLVKIAKANDIYYFNGSSDDVFKRLTDASELFGFDYVIGITGENPLFSIEYANLIVDHCKKNQSDFIEVSGLPIGTAVWGMRVKAMKLISAIKKQVNTEIWGYLIKQPKIFDIKTIQANKEDYWPDLRITTDYPEDYKFISEIFDKIPQPNINNFQEVISFLRNNNRVLKLNGHLTQGNLSQNEIEEINKFYRDNELDILRKKKEVYSG